MCSEAPRLNRWCSGKRNERCTSAHTAKNGRKQAVAQRHTQATSSTLRSARRRRRAYTCRALPTSGAQISKPSKHGHRIRTASSHRCNQGGRARIIIAREVLHSDVVRRSRDGGRGPAPLRRQVSLYHVRLFVRAQKLGHMRCIRWQSDGAHGLVPQHGVRDCLPESFQLR